ncbi:hypothetical protein L2E82_13808 [Cichorium intybus]|uniref:Uncharacterized protein n=1 Tax=Cichorium intybus TaxID=13427 RepID=A0ACB9EZF8_CICIN|nr:hypothetical protein L2E82_13808 [Cichorium intybus]
MCSYGGHIVPRPHDKTLCYVGGDTRIVVVDRHTTLSDLTRRLAKTLLRSSISSTTTSFTLKYQLPSEDLDSLISVTTDEDLENMIDEYERLNSSTDSNKSSRLRLFLFPSKPESVSSIGSLLESTNKSEDWFLNALNGTSSGFSDTSSVNCLLGLEEDVSIPEKKDVNNKGLIGKNLRGNNSVQDVQSVPDSPMLETSSSFGSASSSPSLANLPPLRVNADDQQKVVGGIEEQFSHISVQQQQIKLPEDVSFLTAPAPVVITGVPIATKVAITENPNRVLSEDDKPEQGFQMAYLKQQQQHQHQQQQQYQQKQSIAFDLPSPGSVSSDGSITNPLSRRNPPAVYQDPSAQPQFSTNNNNRASDPSNIHDQNTRIQMQQQQIHDSGYLISTPTTQADPQHPQLHHQPQFIHTAVPPPQYIHHHPSGVVPMASYYQMYPSNSQHHAPRPLDQHNFVYYMPTVSAPPTNQVPPPSTLFTAPRTVQPATKSEPPAGMYRTANPGTPVTQPRQLQPQYFAYEFSDPSQQGQHVYYAAQPLPPQSAAQYQTMASSLPVEAASHLQTDNSMKQQQVRTPQT